MKLREALLPHEGEIVSFVGAGGKTTAMYRLGRELAADGWKVIVTTTTMIRPPLTSQVGALVVENEADRALCLVRQALQQTRIVALGSLWLESESKLRGVAPAQVLKLAGLADVILVEADGARGLSIKAPAPHEPAIAHGTTLVIPVMAVDAIGRRLTNQIAHRPQIVAEVTGMQPGEEITPLALAHLLVHPQGGLKAVPAGCRVVPLINKAEDQRTVQQAREVAMAIKGNPALTNIVIGAVDRADPVRECWRKVSAVVLAAGASTRFGTPKQLIPVGDKTMLAHVLDTVRATSVDETIVVLGYKAEQIAGQVPGWCRVVVNHDWHAGISSSIRAGIDAINSRSEAALFVLGDQPRVSSNCMERILLAYYGGSQPIVVPSHAGQRGNPVLMGRALFPSLRALHGDIGGRQVMETMPDATLVVECSGVDAFLDIDTMEDYERYSKDMEAIGGQ